MHHLRYCVTKMNDMIYIISQSINKADRQYCNTIQSPSLSELGQFFFLMQFGLHFSSDHNYLDPHLLMLGIYHKLHSSTTTSGSDTQLVYICAYLLASILTPSCYICTYLLASILTPSWYICAYLLASILTPSWYMCLLIGFNTDTQLVYMHLLIGFNTDSQLVYMHLLIGFNTDSQLV